MLSLKSGIRKKKIHPVKKLKLWLKRKFGWLGKPVIIPYTGYGNKDEIYFIGCVSEDKALEKPDPKNTKWQNLITMIRRFSADVLPGVSIKATFSGIEAISVTDEFGIFRFSINLKNKEIILPQNNWLEIKLEFLDLFEGEAKAAVMGKVLLANPNECNFGIISDIDDTILVSHSTRFIRKLRLMLFNNAYTRLPFEGVAGFYRALHLGYSGKCFNPIFYVSNSQWNLFDLLSDFCKFRKIPEGVMLLQELRPFKPRKLIKKRRAIARHPHKMDKIRSIFTTYDFFKFILIGDSGQKDAEIYQLIAQEFPDRVLAIYIRDTRKSREKRVMLISSSLKQKGVEMLLMKDSEYGARHAIEKGLIAPQSLNDIIREKEIDKQSTITI